MSNEMIDLGNVAIPKERYEQLSQQDKDVLIATLVSNELRVKQKQDNLDKVVRRKKHEIAQLQQKIDELREENGKNLRKWQSVRRTLLDAISELTDI